MPALRMTQQTVLRRVNSFLLPAIALLADCLHTAISSAIESTLYWMKICPDAEADSSQVRSRLWARSPGPKQLQVCIEMSCLLSWRITKFHNQPRL